MKKILFALVLILSLNDSFAQQANTVIYEYKMFTTVESVIPAGMGRSRLISTDKDSQIQEKDLENFFSLVGINFKNIQNNDQVITSKINEFAKDGWELTQTVNGVYGPEKGTGLFITRYVFRKAVK
ncbi:MAG: hypothetical protein JNJ41_10445 [Bacteroidia bacterium]|nr:hypothetical protein [Bacteroidia bacterium]